MRRRGQERFQADTYLVTFQAVQPLAKAPLVGIVRGLNRGSGLRRHGFWRRRGCPGCNRSGRRRGRGCNRSGWNGDRRGRRDRSRWLGRSNDRLFHPGLFGRRHDRSNDDGFGRRRDGNDRRGSLGGRRRRSRRGRRNGGSCSGGGRRRDARLGPRGCRGSSRELGSGFSFGQRFLALTAEQVDAEQDHQRAADHLHQRRNTRWLGDAGGRCIARPIFTVTLAAGLRRRSARARLAARGQTVLASPLCPFASGPALVARALRTGFLGHAVQSLSASAPPMISISSVVIAACRARLYTSVRSAMTSDAFLVAESIAVIRAPSSEATDS